MIQTADVVTADFPGATGTKRRPAVVVSSRVYHQVRPDVILGLVTSQLGRPLEPTDYLLQDWHSAGLHKPSVFRPFLFTLPASQVTVIGHLSTPDWEGVQSALKSAVAISQPSV